MIVRVHHQAAVTLALRRGRVVALIGPRQSGKTTLARTLVGVRSPNYFDLEDPRSLARLAEPMTALSSLRGLVVIDEVQRRPDLFPVLRVLADRRPLPARFLVLGSASPDLLRQSSESLAGRLETIVIGGFTPDEAGAKRLPALWRRGGFPRSLLAPSEAASVAWRQQFIQTYVERDIPLLGISIPAATLLRFWTMVAHYHGGVWNAAEAARSMAVSEPTARRYLDLLSGLFLIRQLQPWHENLKKRQVKAPKVYVRDSGILHSLLGIDTDRDLLSHPKAGASWEGVAIEWALDVLQPQTAHFWATHQGAELDLLVVRGGRRYGIEIKRQDAPSLTPSMRIALADLKLEHLVVLYPGDEPYTLAPNVSVVPMSSLVSRDVGALLGRRTGPRR
ncbi:MAG: ATP-binding protein [Vicinamibacterales bacterium]